MGYRRDPARLRDPRVVTDFDAIIAANYTKGELWELRRLVVSAWLLALEAGDAEAKAAARTFWARRGAL